MVKSLLTVAFVFGVVPAGVVSVRHFASPASSQQPPGTATSHTSGRGLGAGVPMPIPSPAADTSASATPSPASLAPNPVEAAVDAALTPLLPAPSIRTNPNRGFVGLPLWVWLDSWQAVTVTIPGSGITATATPTTVRWSTDQGQLKMCVGPGTRYRLGTPPDQQSTDCSLDFAWSSAGMAPPPGDLDPNDGSVSLTASVVWQIGWTSPAGDGTGVLPLETSSSVYLRVEQVESVEAVS
jgi:hypothetical protein